MNRKQISDIFKKVDTEYPEKELAGVYESVLHLTKQFEYMNSEQGKELLVDEFGELQYETQKSNVEKSLKTRKAELEFLKQMFSK